MRIEIKKERLKRNAIILAVTMAIIGVMLLVQAMIQVTGNKNNAKQTLQMLLEQTVSVIEANEKDEATLIESLKEDYIVRAQAVSYMLTNNPDAENDMNELEKIAGLLEVDEIHLFDETGTIYGGTTPQYYGYSFESGEQMAYFKPMLEDKTLTMCQDVTNNTAENKPMMYAIVWKEDGSYMVQVGIAPVRLLNELHNNEISKVVQSMPMYEGIQIYVADKENGNILGASDLNEIGNTLDEIGFPKEEIDLSVPVYNTVKINGERSYCVFEETGDYVVGIVQNCAEVNSGVQTTLLIVFVYLCMAAGVLSLILRRMNHRVQMEKDKRLKLQDRDLQMLKQQLSIIEAVSKDYTDVMLIDIREKKSAMLKKCSTMVDYNTVLNEKWLPYDETWKNFIDQFVVAEDQMRLSQNIKLERVMQVLSENEECTCNYQICYHGKLYNYQIKFVNMGGEEKDKNIIVGAFRNIDDIVEQERKRIQLERQSNTDELTKLSNRRAYESDIREHYQVLKEDFVYVLMDVNGLKETNDTLGHDVGDDLLRGAVECMNQCFGQYGRIYRIGGDEFVAIISADEEKTGDIKRDFEITVSGWSRNIAIQLSISSGYASKKEFPDMKISELAKVADARMYRAKENYYSQRGINRRGRR
jgi:diguanylate cyclase (GGDEF)-like protein